MRSLLLDRGRLRDATLISVLAYAGLRPQEALALEWRHARDRTLLVERALSDGELKVLKNRRQPARSSCSPQFAMTSPPGGARPRPRPPTQSSRPRPVASGERAIPRLIETLSRAWEVHSSLSLGRLIEVALEADRVTGDDHRCRVLAIEDGPLRKRLDQLAT